ncbi:hypothetical protein [Kribbella italica]|uniref:WD40 repeat domain-containing protein n=1 Tax=Kribbella italica TaxID=1540520 RepID=A0A7W9J126_9ACTN|nr:hypothetical protein [Kribbella italica]MBB5833676.1 hypothetical protein [Kribbella italica]
MNDTETRLRDYLHTKAATVPDGAEPPGLDEAAARKRHLWPVVLAAAAIGAILVLTVPFLTRLGDKTDPAKPAPALAVPYTLSILDSEGSGTKTLHDGKTAVQVPNDVFSLSSRVDGGWAGTVSVPRTGGGNAQRIGVLRPDGTFRAFGPKDTNYLAVSPDRRQLATAEPLGGGKTRIATYDVASGRQVAAVMVPHQTSIVYGWNKNGIWFAQDYKVGAQPLVWQPSTGRLIQLSVRGFDLRLIAPPNADRVMLVTRVKQGAWCIQAARLAGSGLVVDREHCGTGGRAIYPDFSADGSTILDVDQNLVVDVATGRKTKLQLPGPLEMLASTASDGSGHVLVEFGHRMLGGEPRRGLTPPPSGALTPNPSSRTPVPNAGRLVPEGGGEVYRCDLGTGACQEALKIPKRGLLRLIQP